MSENQTNDKEISQELFKCSTHVFEAAKILNKFNQPLVACQLKALALEILNQFNDMSDGVETKSANNPQANKAEYGRMDTSVNKDAKDLNIKQQIDDCLNEMKNRLDAN